MFLNRTKQPTRIKLTIEPDYDDSVTSNATANTKLNGVPNSKAGNDDDSMYEAAYNLVIGIGYRVVYKKVLKCVKFQLVVIVNSRL